MNVRLIYFIFYKQKLKTPVLLYESLEVTKSLKPVFSHVVDLVMLFENSHLLGDLSRKYLFVSIIVHVPESALKSAVP